MIIVLAPTVNRGLRSTLSCKFDLLKPRARATTIDDVPLFAYTLGGMLEPPHEGMTPDRLGQYQAYARNITSLDGGIHSTSTTVLTYYLGCGGNLATFAAPYYSANLFNGEHSKSPGLKPLKLQAGYKCINDTAMPVNLPPSGCEFAYAFDNHEL